MRFLEKNAPGVEVLTKTYLRSLVRTYFMKQGSEEGRCDGATATAAAATILTDEG